MDQENKKHICPIPGEHCCQCEGCVGVCNKTGRCVNCGGMHQHIWAQHTTRRLAVMAVAVIIAFFIGYSMGKMKGYFMATFQRSAYQAWPSQDLYR